MYKNVVKVTAIACWLFGMLNIILGLLLGIESQTGFPLIGLGLFLFVYYNELQIKEYLESKDFLQKQLEKVINNESINARKTNRK